MKARRRPADEGYPQRSIGLTFNPVVVFLGSVLVLALLGALLYWNPEASKGPRTENLMLYCAAGIKPPVEAVRQAYEEEFGVSIRIDYGGSGTLLSKLAVAGKGDLYLAADSSYIQIAREKGLVAEAVPLARIHPVIGVQKGNPKRIHSVQDLTRKDVRLALANPDAASVGKQTRLLLERSGDWDAIRKHAKVLKPTVGDVANDIKLGTVDAGAIWDATANQYPEIEIVEISPFQGANKNITIGVLTSCGEPAAALHFVRYLGAPEKGLPAFSRYGYAPVDGDSWADKPEIVLYSGAVNRPAISKTLKEFEKREGVRITTVFNGCGVLVGQMRLLEKKGAKLPDAYFACDNSFVPQVQDLFLKPLEISETKMVIVVPKGNPRRIESLRDLATPGLKIGVANPQQSALGALTVRLLNEAGLLDDIMKNVETQVPTADLLVNQMRVGSLDAAIVYEANTAMAKEDLTVIQIDHPRAAAIQPLVIGKNSPKKRLVRRLLEKLTSAESKRRFEETGFRWRNQPE